jgi:hypothetical protein
MSYIAEQHETGSSVCYHFRLNDWSRRKIAENSIFEIEIPVKICVQ